MHFQTPSSRSALTLPEMITPNDGFSKKTVIAPDLMKHPTRDHEAGMTLLETMIAVGLTVLFLGSLFTMNGSTMQTLKMARESARASQVLQQRIESLRIANWQLITRPSCDWLVAHAFMIDSNNDGVADHPDGSELLKNESESLTIEPYGSVSASPTPTPTPTRLTGTGGHTGTVVTHDDTLVQENALKVTWTITYAGSPNNRPMSQTTTTILAKGGVAK